MPATPAQTLTNLLTELSRILGDVVSAVGGVAGALVALFWTLVSATLAVGRAFVTAAVDLFQTTVGLIYGNLVLLVIVAFGYYLLSKRQPKSKNGRGKTRR